MLTNLNKGVDVFLVNIFSIWLLNNPTFKCRIGENAALQIKEPAEKVNSQVLHLYTSLFFSDKDIFSCFNPLTPKGASF